MKILLIPSVHFPESVQGREDPWLLSDCCRRSLSGRGLCEWKSSCRTNRTLQSPESPGSRLCLLPTDNNKKVFYEQEITLSVCVIWDNHPAKENMYHHRPTWGIYLFHHQTWWSSFTETITIRRGGQWATELKQYCSATKAICSVVAIWPSCGTLLHCPAKILYIHICLLAPYPSFYLTASLKWCEDHTKNRPLKETSRIFHLKPFFFTFSALFLSSLWESVSAHQSIKKKIIWL